MAERAVRAGSRTAHSRIKKKGRPYLDYSLLTTVIFLLLFGLIMVYSASSYEASLKFEDSTYYLRSQLRATVLGFVVMILISYVDYHFWKKTAVFVYLGSCILVLLVMTSLGITKNGARRWLNFGVSLQPAEAAKLGVIIFFATLICAGGSKMLTNKKRVGICIFLAFIPTALVLFITKNLSSAIIIFGIVYIMLFIASPKSWYYVLLFLIVLVVAGVFVHLVASGVLTDNYRYDRIKAWLHPEAYASGIGYQTLQSLYSIGAGGIFGKGLGQSTQKLGFVPEAQNDMIFSIICEELGMFGAMAVILMFLILIWRFLVVASNAPDEFGAMLVVGVIAHIAIQVVLNIAVVTNSIPNTGITLPFISFGGTSVLFLLIEIGIVLNVSRSIQVA